MAVREEKEVVCVLPDGKESFHTVYKYGDARWDFRSAAETAVRDAGLTTPRNNPQQVTVKVFSQAVQKGKIHRVNCGDYLVMPTLEAMTEDEYNEELSDALRTLPDEFHPFVRSRAWNSGHSAGYEEVVLLAREIAAELCPCVKEYMKANKIK
jgi:hypothetical protein